MKIHIIYNFSEKPTGGGNQFLAIIRDWFREHNFYTENLADADVILFNSHHCPQDIIQAKFDFQSKVFVHRIDGPMKLYNSQDDLRDEMVNLLNNFVADATIFQSEWSKKRNLEMFKYNKFPNCIVIQNTSSERIFNSCGCGNEDFKNRRVKLISTSWSSNWKKGFKVYQWLDDNLDFDKYEVTFVGNTPCEFTNINHLPPLNSAELAKVLKQNDIYITASQNDPCSNSLIEALHCGLPAIALNDGGHPEIVKDGGLLFETADEIPSLLEQIVNNYSDYQNNIDLPTIDTVANQYYNFMKSIVNHVNNSEYTPKKVSARDIKNIKNLIKPPISLTQRIRGKIKSIFKHF